MMTANQWIRNQNEAEKIMQIFRDAAEKHLASIEREDSSVHQLLLAFQLRDKAQELNIGFQVDTQSVSIEQAEGLINMRARAARVRILQRAFNSLCEVSR